MVSNLGRQTQKTSGEDRPPTSMKRWIIISVISFVIGLIVAQIFMPSAAMVVEGGGEAEMSEGSSGSTQPLNETEQSSIVIIIIAVGILAFLIGFAYYREKRKS